MKIYKLVKDKKGTIVDKKGERYKMVEIWKITIQIKQ